MIQEFKDALPCGHILEGGSVQYKIEDVLGQGTFGIVYKCNTMSDTAVRTVAVKEFFMKNLNGRTDNGEVRGTEMPLFIKYRERFHKETKNLSSMKHENIVKVLEVFDAYGTSYMVMEYAASGSLDHYISQKERLNEIEAFKLAIACCNALDHMHEHHMLHLDLKPLNIVMDNDGKPKLSDFGLSKVFDESGKPESESAIGLGTPGYAPLEQAVYDSTKEFAPTLDVYAMGATIFNMLTGITPPTAINVLNCEGILARMLDESGITPSSRNMVVRAMDPIISRRIQNIKELANEAQALYEVLSIEKQALPTNTADNFSPNYIEKELLHYMSNHIIPGTIVHYHPFSMYYLIILTNNDNCTIKLTETDRATLTEWLDRINVASIRLQIQFRLARINELKQLLPTLRDIAQQFSEPYLEYIVHNPEYETYNVFDTFSGEVIEHIVNKKKSYHAILVYDN